MNKYLRLPAKKLFIRHLGLHLGFRMNVARGAPTLLPTLIRKVVDHFMIVTKQTSEDVRASYTQQACDAIIHCGPNAFNLATTPTDMTCKKVAKDPIETCCLVIAAAMKDNQLIARCLSHGVSVWSKTRAFDTPLEVAATSRSVAFMSQFLEHSESGLAKTTKFKASQILACIIFKATRSRDWDMAIVLIDWWYQHLRKPSSSHVINWVHQAVTARAVRFLHHVLDQDHTSATKAELVRDLYSVWPGAYLDFLAGALLDRKVMDISEVHHHEIGSSGSLLALASEKGSIPLAKRYLDAGLSPEGLRDPMGALELPLVQAMKRYNVEMVRLLLEYGANPEPAYRQLSWLWRPTNDREAKSIRTLIREAMDPKKAKTRAHARKPALLSKSSPTV